jgi:hypothetical protein
VKEKEASQKDYNMDFSMRLEEKLVLTSKIDLKDQACCICTNPEEFPKDSPSNMEYYDETLTLVIEEIVPVFMNTRTTIIHIYYEM